MADCDRLHVLVEGQTEETVMGTVIKPYLESSGWLVTYSIVKTKRPAAGPAHRGGITCWANLKRDLRLLLRDPSVHVVTTMIDYYAFPSDAPGMVDRPNSTPSGRVAHVESAIGADVGDRRFLPHLTLHEFEAWVFAAADRIADLHGPDVAEKLRQDVARAGGPELINDGRETAPSKRLRDYCPTYVKTMDGPLVVSEFGIPALRARCPHLNDWFVRLETLRGQD